MDRREAPDKFHPTGSVGEHPQQGGEARMADARSGIDIQHMVDHHRHIARDFCKMRANCGKDCQSTQNWACQPRSRITGAKCASTSTQLRAYSRASGRGRTGGIGDRACPLRANCTQAPGRNRCVGDTNGAQPRRVARGRIQNRGVVIAMRIALHADTARKREPVQHGEIRFAGCVGGRIAAAFREREARGRPEDVGVAVAGKRRWQLVWQLRVRIGPRNDGGTGTAQAIAAA